MANFETLKTAIDANINTNGNQQITGKVMNSVLKQMVDVTEEQYSELNDKLESLPKGDVFYKDRRYPNLSVGFADNLVGRGESIPAEFSFRASGGKSIKDGAARIKRLRGNSVVWNNVVDLVNMPMDAAGVTATELSGRRIHLQGEYDNVGDRNLYVLDKQDVAEGHYYAVILQGSKYYGIYGYGGIVNESTDAAVVLATGTGSGLTLLPRTSLDAGTYVDEVVTPQIIDLTLMFGAGDEPTTIEEYYARKPIVADEFAYNEGEVIHMAAAGIKSVGDNAWDEEWEQGYIATDGSEDGSGNTEIRSKNYIKVLPNERYFFPYYLGQIYGQSGNLYFRVLFYDRDKTIIGYTTTYTNWEIDSWIVTMPPNCHYIRFYTNIEGGTYNNDFMITLVHSGWKQDTDAGYQPYWEDRLIFDQRIKEHFPNGMKKWDIVYNKNRKGYIVKGTGVRAFEDGDKDDATVITDGLSTIYELSIPEIIEYDEPVNLDYRVADFGTEQMLTDHPSAPIAADIIYQFNAVDMIREHELEIAQLQKVIATMQTQLSSLANSNLD